MATPCSRCANIDLEEEDLYLLRRVSAVQSLALEGCPGCKFFLDLIELSEESDVDEQSYLLLARQPERKNRVLLLAMDGNPNMSVVSTLRLCTSYGIEPVESAEYEGENEELGRIVPLHSADPQCLNLAKEWFHRCVNSHGGLCAMQNPKVQPPTRLIHVPLNEDEPLTLKVTSGLRDLHYATLSYCWGGIPAFRTTRATLVNRLTGFSLHSLPKMFQDAIRLVRAFGLQWIWIDALCIIQGDQADWSHESALMADVYGNAAFTICADHAESVDKDLFNARHHPVSHKFGLNNTESLCLQHISKDWDTMTDQCLYTRGWALQERLLARRVIHFLDDQIAWECCTTLYREGSRGRESHTPTHFNKSSFSPYFQHRYMPDALPSAECGTDMGLHARLRKWNEILQELSVRDFTMDSDTLPSVSGLASALELPDLGRYFAGVWEYNPFITMSWHVRYSQNIPIEEYRAPSWSWAWTDGELIWHDHVFPDSLTPTITDAWRAWDKRWGPRLLRHNMILKSEDPKGEVLPGSYLVMTGFCRDVYVAPHPGHGFEPWPYGDTSDDGATEQGYAYYVHMDKRTDDLASVMNFSPILFDLHVLEPGSMSRYLCVILGKEKKAAAHRPMTILMVLEEAEDQNTFRRVGVIVFNFDEHDQSGWRKRELKLI